MFWGIDQYSIMLVLPAFLFSLYAQFRVKSTFNKYRGYMNAGGWTGADIARQILDRNGLRNVYVDMTRGELTDHYDPRERVVRLSETVYGSASVAAIGVAAHETGHALQHKEGYGPLALRSSFVPVANIGSAAGPYMAIFGILFSWPLLTNAGILLYAAAVAFYLITLPVEFNASRRAIKTLETSGALSAGEIEPVRKVLSAAAMTYVASAAVAMASLLRLILLSNSRRNDN